MHKGIFIPACLILIGLASVLSGCEQKTKGYTIVENADGNDTWQIYTTDGLLAWNEYVMTDYGSEEAPKYDNLDTNAILMADIRLPDPGKGMDGNWIPIGFFSSTVLSRYYTGTFDGNGYVISNMQIDGNESFVGMFGGLDGTVRNLTLENVRIEGTKAGAIAGTQSRGTIEGCHVSGELIGKAIVQCYIRN